MSRFVLTAQLQLQAPNNVAQVVRQIQSQLNNVTVNVQVQNAAQAQRQLQQVTAQTIAATTAADRMGRAFAISIRRFAAFSIATRAVGLFTSTLSDAIKTAIDFEREMVRVSQVTGESIGKLQFLTKAITDLSTGLGVSSKDLLQTGQLLLQAGVNAKDTEVALKTLAKAALAPNFDSITETTEGAIAILAQFQEGVGALEKQLGSINAVAGAFAVEAGDLIDVIRRTGGVFKSSGGNLNELLALFTSVRATTRESAESIGTGLRTIFTRIQRPKTIEFLKQFGVELVDLEGKFVGPFEAVKRLSEALSGLGEGDLTFIRIAEELGGFRQIGKVLPLLQQFSTAQQALNVANKAGNSLTNDAATAQLALAVRITKVKEEFLALVRGMTETKTFQIMANTALSFASALIKIGEAIKPLLPLLAAVAAVNLAKGLGSFAGGLMGGMRSGRTFSHGGPVKRFARGGLVPGSGNRDTVPAMLMPGEFVIKKSSVNKLGAGNLAAMNENRYATGTRGRGIPNPTAASLRGTSPVPPNKLAAKNTKKYRGDPGSTGSFKAIFDVNPNEIGAFVLQPAKGSDGFYKPSAPTPFILPPNTKYAQFFAKSAGLSKEDLGLGIKAELSPSSYPTFYPGKSDLQSSQYSQIIRNATQKGLRLSLTNVANQVGRQKLLDVDPAIKSNRSLLNSAVSNISQDQNLLSTIDGYLFEGMITALTGATAAGNRANFDFPAGSISQNKNKLKALFGNNSLIDSLRKAEAKRSIGEVRDGLQSKIINEIKADKKAGVRLRRFATGGNVGTDTVPALLTPGEFVVNRSSAKRIGYGNLNRMNKVGKYAKGGVVQHFAAGGTASAQSGGSLAAWNSAFTSNTRLVVQNSQAQQQSSRSMKDVVTNNKMFAATMVTSLIQGFLPAVDESSSALNRVAHNLLGLATTVTSVMFALEAFGVSLSIKNIKDLFGSGPGSLGGLFKTAFKGFKGGASFGDLRGIAKAGPLAKAAYRGGDVLRQGRNIAGGGISSFRRGLNTQADPSLLRPSFTLGRQGKSLTSLSGGRVPLSARIGNLAGRATQGINIPNLGIGKALSPIAQRLSPYTSAIPRGFQAGFSGKNIVGGNVLSRMIGGASKGVGGLARGLSAGFTEKNLSFSKILGSNRGVLAKAGGLAGKAASGVSGAAGTVASKAGSLAANVTQKLTANLTKAAGSALGVGLAFQAVAGMIDAYSDYQGKLNKSIEQGNIAEAKKNAAEAAGADAVNTLATSAIALGAAFGPPGVAIAALGAAVLKVSSEIPVIGPAIKWAATEIMRLFGGNTSASIEALAASQAGAVATQKELEQAQRAATNAMEDFEKGSISASEALTKIRSATDSVNAQEKRASDFATKNLENRAGGISGMGRNALSFVSFGMVESSSQRNQRLGQQSAEQLRQSSRFQAQAFQMESPARSAMIRSGFARGQNREDIRNQALGIGTSNDKLARLQQLGTLSRKLGSAGDTEGANAANEAFNQLKEEINQVDRELESLEKEVARAKAAFDAMNLGLRGPTATAQAMSASMTKFAAGLEVGGNMFSANAEFLAEAVSGAAQAMNPEEINSAMKGVRDSLSDMGVSPQYLAKFEANTQAFVQAQQNYNKAFENIKGRIQGDDFQKMDADSLKKAFSEELTVGLGEEAKKNLTAIIEGMQISDTEVDQILGGNLQIFGDKLGEAGQKQFEQIMKIAQERQKAEQILIGFIQKRIEAERNFAEAQKEAVDLVMEGREIQGKYGGRAVSQDERRAAIVAKANANRAGISNLKTGSVAELRARNAEIFGKFSTIEKDRTKQGGMAGATGVEKDATQQDLAKAQKDQVQTIRDMIKLEEESLRIIQEKNKLEKASMESLISGDIEKFFEQQAAVGAQAALAAGDRDLANQFGAKAVGDAFLDITRQMEAGVEEIFGQRLAGQGGLAEQAAGAALGARGIMDPRMAQVMAGTTPAEEASKRRLQELGGLLGETGALGVAMSEMQVQTAQINVSNAQVELATIEERGRQVAAGMYRGGVVYASRGMFVPRGTDTVPAMLTPGEFVVRRESVNRGNNLQLLKAINNGGGSPGYSRGGKVGYYREGGLASGGIGGLLQSAANVLGINTQLITDLSNTFVKFNTQFQESIKNLQNTRLHLTMDSVNVNVNINGGFLNQVSGEAKNEIMKQVVNEIKNKYRIGNNGNIVEKTGGLPTPGQGS